MMIRLATSLWLLTGVASGESLPPVGKRIYIIQKGAIFAPAEIKAESESKDHRNWLRDPIVDQNSRRSAVKVRQQTGGKKGKMAQLSFKTLPVKGRVSSPRIAFDLKPLKPQLIDIPNLGSTKSRLVRQIKGQESRVRVSP